MSSNGYPFISRKQVADRIASEPAFAIDCVRLIDGKWMASHKVRAGMLVAKIAAGDLSPEDLAAAVALVTPYARTISRILRERQITEGAPELAAQAAVFGIVRSVPAVPVASPEAAPVPVVDTTAPEAPAAPPPKRRGRPPGSRTRVREEEPAPKRRRRGS